MTTNRRRRPAARIQAEKHRKQRNQRIAIAAAAAVAAIIALIVVGGLFRGDGDVQTSATAQRDGRILGSPDARVVIEAWEDFQCPVCKVANNTVLAQLIEDYVDTGQVQIYYRYFSFLGDESIWAAEAAESAAAQGRFWEYHDALFSAQNGENKGAFAKDKLRAIAEEVGLDMTAFNADLDSGKYESVVEDERSEGRKLGVDSTPTFFVDGVQVADWRDYTAFRALIELQLSSTQ